MRIRKPQSRMPAIQLSRFFVLLKPIRLRRKLSWAKIGFDLTPEKPVNPIKSRSREA